MSKAFVRESDFDDLPPLPSPVSALPPGSKNYLTAQGAERLRRELAQLVEVERPPLFARSIDDLELKRELQIMDQRIRALRESLSTAEVVVPPAEPDDVVRFGSTVTVRDEQGEESRYRLVGVDEADPERGWVSWTSPLARALMNARHGSSISFTTPSGTKKLDVTAVAYETSAEVSP